jgi:hypothetical protein
VEVDEPGAPLAPELLPVVLEALPLPGLPTPLAEPLDDPDPRAGADPVDELVPLDDARAPADAEPLASPAEPFPVLTVEPLPEAALGGPLVPLAPAPLPELPPEPRPDVMAPLSAADVPIEELPQPTKNDAESKHATLDDDLFELILLVSEDASRSGPPAGL